MKTLFENLLDIGSINSTNDVLRVLTPIEFRYLYKRKLKSVNADTDNPICITGKYDLLWELCKDFKAKNINVSGMYPEIKIKTINGFASNCKNLVDFQGPDPHENYSDIESLVFFFKSDTKLMTFDLSGIAKSAKEIKNIDYMFNTCTSIENIDLGNFRFSKLITADNVFCDCISLKRINLGNSNASIEAPRICWGDVNLEEFNAPNMTLLGNSLFFNCENLKYINVKYIDVSNEYYYNMFKGCSKLESVNIFGLGKNTMHDFDYIDMSWATSLNDKSWDFLFGSMRDGNNTKILLPDTPKKKNLIEKYENIAKKYNFELI